MRVSRTLPAFAALLFLTACSAEHAEVVLPGNTPTHDSGTWIGSGNTVAGDSVSTPNSSPAGGVGQFGSGN